MTKITTYELVSYIVNQLENGVDVTAIAQKMAALLTEERRTRDFPAVMRAVEEELSRRGSGQVSITAAHATTEETKKQLAKLLDVQNPVFSEVIDASLIGGVKARSGESEIDLTVRGRLQRFKAQIVNQEV